MTWIVLSPMLRLLQIPLLVLALLPRPALAAPPLAKGPASCRFATEQVVDPYLQHQGATRVQVTAPIAGPLHHAAPHAWSAPARAARSVGRPDGADPSQPAAPRVPPPGRRITRLEPDEPPRA